MFLVLLVAMVDKELAEIILILQVVLALSTYTTIIDQYGYKEPALRLEKGIHVYMVLLVLGYEMIMFSGIQYDLHY
ncbi:hypothetical protein FACS1894176_05810 [Bacteroidia bacterium]|nr:hypothetical protein FACS189428_2660 [Clostridia bacterium]GHV25986.1 hypothetical protein FACS1894176_05810 [Bacteroidia bacterium]